MKIAITGAGGFLGTELLRQLSQNQDVTVFAFTFDFERARDTFVHSDHIIPVDNSEASTFDYSEVDVLLNCAFPRNVEDESFAAGLDFIQQVFMKAARDHVKAVVNISSQSVYSQKRLESADETAPIILESKYAVGKYGVELLVNSLFQDVRHTNLRMASLIGAGFNQRIVNKFAMKVAAGEQITLTGGKQLFGFMDVRDAASGIIKVMLNKSATWDEAYNLGTNKACSLLEIAKSTRDYGIECGYSCPEIIVVKDDAWQNSAIICDRFCEKFEWNPQYPLIETIKEIYKSLR